MCYSCVKLRQTLDILHSFSHGVSLPLCFKMTPILSVSFYQMLLQKLKGPSYCPWAINTFSRGESRIKNSQSGIDSGIGESMTRTMTSERLQTPPKAFSPAFHNLIELCLHQDPEQR